MKAIISPNAYSKNHSINEWLKEHASQWVEVETEHLFNNQYNIGPCRLFDQDILAIQDDARIGVGKCKYCGNLIRVSDVVCAKNQECLNYGVHWFNAKTTFFIAHPNGIKQPEKFDAIKIGTYTLANYPHGWRLYNCRKRFDFKFDGSFWIHGCGYTRREHLDIPHAVERKLIQVLKEVQQ